VPDTIDALDGFSSVVSKKKKIVKKNNKISEEHADYDDDELSIASNNNNNDDDYGPKTTTGMPQLAKLPKKPSSTQRHNINLLTGNIENGKPRDRDLPKNVRHVTDRKHLPAPPLGQVAGHGLSLEKFIEKGSILGDLKTNSESLDWTKEWRS
jgi:hypothetical protein